MKIRQLTVYKIDGVDKTFRDPQEVRRHVENCLGAIIDSLPNRLPSKDALALLELLISKRAELCQLLDGTILDSGDDHLEPDLDLFELTNVRKKKQ